MRGSAEFFKNIDFTTVVVYVILVLFGVINIYAAEYSLENPHPFWDLSYSAGKQALWFAMAIVLVLFIYLIDYKIFESFAYIFYGIAILLLIMTLFIGVEIAGSKSWLNLGFMRLQPSEIAKYATVLALARYLSSPSVKPDNFKDILVSSLIIVLPIVLIILQGDTGSALVFAVLILPLFRLGLNPLPLVVGVFAIIFFILTLLNQSEDVILYSVVFAVPFAIIFILLKKKTMAIVTGVALVFGVIVVLSTDFFVNEVLKPHQQNRIKAFVNPEADPLGAGYNVTQSKIAIGSGGFAGKGFLQGTVTKFDFVPEDTTDFIFCTLAEEHGWIGSSLVVILFAVLIIKLVLLSERQKSPFSFVIGYGIAGIFLFHYMINIGMTIGLFPVIGIPLPFFSYGGSSLWAFTLLLFTFLKLDGHRTSILERTL